MNSDLIEDRARSEPSSVVDSEPSRVIAITALASYALLVMGLLTDRPRWLLAAAILLPWIPVSLRESVRTYRHYRWLALFYVVVVTQFLHVGEHVAQMTQIHALHQPLAASRGVFGQLDIEWVHFLWNTWLLLAIGLLLWRFRRNPWLWLALVVAVWHELEHVVMTLAYLATGKPGGPGLLSLGGRIGGGLPWIRPDVHFVYNLIETVPLPVALVYQVKHVGGLGPLPDDA